MKKQHLLLPLILLQIVVFAQDVKYPIFTYGTDTVYSDEFLRVFNKNKRGEQKASQAEIEEYLQLYIKFKLKVTEAYARQMDTFPDFIEELGGYRKQLAQPYLTDKSVNERLIKEAYDRSLQEVRASHLLIMCPKDASPADTLKAYERIINLRNRIVAGQQDFEELAFQLSDDPSAKNNKGDLGYFTSFQMIYPFENAAYNTPIGEVSMPIRTKFGYHLVKVVDKRQAMGDVQVAHIMIKYYNEGDVDSAKRRIDAVYEKLKNGEDWSHLVEEFSEDFSTNADDGKLNWFNRTTPNVPIEFKDAAYSLANIGDFSQPMKTKFGWHIVKLVDKSALKNFEEVRESIRRKVERDSRSELNKSVVLERIKKENNCMIQVSAEQLVPMFDSSLLKGKWVSDSKMKENVLFTIGNENFYNTDFAIYVSRHQATSSSSLAARVNELYQDFIAECNFAYEEVHLEEKYEDFKYIMQEYKDGILLFELTDQEVWSKAINDTIGLQQFYTSHQQEYMWPERAEVSFYSFKDDKTAKKGMKLSTKLTDAELKEKLNSSDALAVTIETKYLNKEALDKITGIEWKSGTYSLGTENNRVKYARVKSLNPPEPKPLEKNLGRVTSDYQTELEQQWIQALMQKYPVHVFDTNVKKLYL